jgi:signal transduction histidine kinase
VNFISLHPHLVGTVDQLFLIRVVMAVTSLIGPVLVLLTHTFPRDEFLLKKRYSATLLVLMMASVALSLLPFVFTDLQFPNGKPIPTPGPGIIVFLLDFVGLFIASFILVWYKMHHSTGQERLQLRIFFLGIVSTFSMMGITTVISVVILKSSSVVFLGPISSIILIGAVAYAMIKYNLFNIQAAATRAFVIIISIFLFAKIFVSSSSSDTLLNAIVFITTLFFSVLLVRNVDKEIHTREKIQDLAKNLSETNWELAKKNEQLRIIDQRKSEFVSIVSHQLRTPITAIKGYASLLMEGTFGSIDETQKGALDKIFVSSNRLAEMVSDFLDISKIEQGTMAYTFKQVDFGKMVGGLLEEFQARAKDKKLTLEFKKGEGAPLMVIADEGKVRQIVSNVIDNSIKYTSSGGVTVSMERDQGRGMIFCKIIDTGVGLSQDDLHHLFGKFTRGSEGSKMNTGGSGLGLYVAKKMLEAHKGNIWVDSEGINKGSTFVIALPADVSPNAPHPGTVTASTTEEGK